MSFVITEVSIRVEQYRPNPNIRAFATITICGAFCVNSIRIIQKASGKLFVVMPSHKTNGMAKRIESPTYYDDDGDPFHFRDVAFPVNPEARMQIDRAVLEAYCRTERSGELVATYDLTSTDHYSLRKAV